MRYSTRRFLLENKRKENIFHISEVPLPVHSQVQPKISTVILAGLNKNFIPTFNMHL